MGLGILLYTRVSDTGTEPPTKTLLHVLCPPSLELKAGASNNEAGQDLIAFLTRRMTK